MRGIDIYDEKPKPIDERLREGRSLKDGLAAGPTCTRANGWKATGIARPAGEKTSSTAANTTPPEGITMASIDQNRRMTSVFGRGRLRYLQNGHGFDLAGNYLGRFNDQGEPEEGVVAAPAAREENSPPATEPEAVDIQPASPRQDDDPLPATPYPEHDGDQPLAEMNIKALKALAKERGISGAANMNKAALIEALGGDEA